MRPYSADIRLRVIHSYENHELALKRAIELAPDASNAFFALGELYMQQKKYSEAEQRLRQGLRIDNHSWRGHFALGRVYWSSGDVQQAAKQIALTLQLNQDLADAHLLAGNICCVAESGRMRGPNSKPIYASRRKESSLVK